MENRDEYNTETSRAAELETWSLHLAGGPCVQLLFLHFSMALGAEKKSDQISCNVTSASKVTTNLRSTDQAK